MGNYRRYSYHSGRQGWTRNPRELIGDHVGIELEVDVRNLQDKTYRSVLDALPNPEGNKAPQLRPIAEMDGTLSGQGGVEIVFPPLSVERVIGKGTFFRRAINTMNKEIPNYQGPRDVGMHVNVNVNGWNERLIQLMILSFNHLPDTFIERIGGRPLSGWCEQHSGVLYGDRGDGRWGITSLGSCSTVLLNTRNNHRTIVNRTAQRLEFRYPVSTLNMDQITRNIAFIYYVRDYLQREITKNGLIVRETLEATFGTPEAFRDKIVGYISTRRKSKKRDLVLESIIYASKNRSKTPRPTVERSGDRTTSTRD